RERVFDGAMRQKSGRGPGPHQAVQARSELRLGRIDQHALAARERLGGEPADLLQAVWRVEVEFHGCHEGVRGKIFGPCSYLRPTWRRAKRTRRGTGRPVEPFSRPLRHAVPAMSRCAQRCLRVKRARNDAAVMLPAGRPPILAKSAKFERSCSW